MQGSVTGVHYGRDMHALYTAGAADGLVKEWDLRFAQRKRPAAVRIFSTEGESHGIISIDIDAAGTRLLASHMSSAIRVYDLRSDANVAACVGHDASNFYVKARFSPDGQSIISGSGDMSAYMWCLPRKTNGEAMPILPKWMLPGHTDEVTSMDASSHVPGLLATVAEDHQLRLWRYSSENVSEPMGLSSVSFPSKADNNMRLAQPSRLKRKRSLSGIQPTERK